MGNEEDTCWGEHWVLYVSDESRESTPEAKTTLYVSQLANKLKKKERDTHLMSVLQIGRAHV